MPLMGTAKERVTELEDRSVTIFQTTCKYKKSGKTKQSIPEYTCNENIRRRREDGREGIWPRTFQT